MNVGDRVIYKYLPEEDNREKPSPLMKGTIVGGPCNWHTGTGPKSWQQYEVLWDGRKAAGWWDEKRLKVIIKDVNIYDELERFLK